MRSHCPSAVRSEAQLQRMPANYTSSNGLRHRPSGQPRVCVALRAGVGDQTGDAAQSPRGAAASARRVSVQIETAVTNSDKRSRCCSTMTSRAGSFGALRVIADECDQRTAQNLPALRARYASGSEIQPQITGADTAERICRTLSEASTATDAGPSIGPARAPGPCMEGRRGLGAPPARGKPSIYTYLNAPNGHGARAAL